MRAYVRAGVSIPSNEGDSTDAAACASAGTADPSPGCMPGSGGLPKCALPSATTTPEAISGSRENARGVLTSVGGGVAILVEKYVGVEIGPIPKRR